MSKKPISKVNNYNMATKKLFLLFVNAAINSYSWHLSQKKRVTTNILNLRWVFIGFVGRHSLGSSRKSPMRICWSKQHIPSPLFIKISWRLWKLHYWVNRHQVIVMKSQSYTLSSSLAATITTYNYCCDCCGQNFQSKYDSDMPFF